MAQSVSPGQFSLFGIGSLLMESPVDPPRAGGSLFPRSRSRRSSPWPTTPGFRAVSLRPSQVPSRPAGRIQPEGPARGSGVCSWPGPAVPASPGCRRHRWTPNTSRPRLPPVTSGSQKAGCANRVFSVQRPFPVCESLPRTTWVQGLSRAATKIKVDVNTLRACPTPWAVVVILGKCPEESRSNAPFPAATAGSR